MKPGPPHGHKLARFQPPLGNQHITMQTVGLSHGRTGAGEDYDPTGNFVLRVTFDYNVYRITSLNEKYWDWGGARNWREFRAAGQEAHGSIK